MRSFSIIFCLLFISALQTSAQSTDAVKDRSATELKTDVQQDSLHATATVNPDDLIKDYMDDQAEEIADNLRDLEIERIADVIRLRFSTALLFPRSDSRLNGMAVITLNDLTTILKKYEDTNIFIECYTYNSGKVDESLRLARERSDMIAAQLINLGINVSRISTNASMKPTPGTITDEARRKNEMVEIRIFASKKLKKSFGKEL